MVKPAEEPHLEPEGQNMKAIDYIGNLSGLLPEVAPLLLKKKEFELELLMSLIGYEAFHHWLGDYPDQDTALDRAHSIRTLIYAAFFMGLTAMKASPTHPIDKGIPCIEEVMLRLSQWKNTILDGGEISQEDLSGLAQEIEFAFNMEITHEQTDQT